MVILSLLGLGTALADDPAALADEIARWAPQRLSSVAPPLTETQISAALSGEHLAGLAEGGGAGLGFAVRVVALPIETVWRALTDNPHLPPGAMVDSSLVVAGTPRTSGHLIYQAMPLPLMADRWWVTRVRYNAALYQQSAGRIWDQAWSDAHHEPEVRAALDPALVDRGRPVARARGGWFLFDLEGRTLVQYHGESHPGGAVPSGLVAQLSLSTLNGTLDAMERTAREHIPSCDGVFQRPDGSPLGRAQAGAR